MLPSGNDAAIAFAEYFGGIILQNMTDNLEEV
jgi:D-alanyl-D-alanine carboxypeptidase